jgi:hypothetical protein
LDEVERKIVRYVADSQPGRVACEHVDASGRRHTLLDKVPVFTARCLAAPSPYPRSGVVACEVLAHRDDEGGRKVARIDNARLFGTKSTEGSSVFVIAAGQLKQLK